MYREEKTMRKVFNGTLALLSASMLTLLPATMYAADSNGSKESVNNSYVVQQGVRPVTVTVVDKTGEPIIGANVFVLSTKAGGATDLDGNIEVKATTGDQIKVSYVGYATQTVVVGNNSSVKVTLEEGDNTLDEVVVVGYGTMRKSDVTGSISVAKGSDLVKAQNFSALDNLRGKASGVTVFSNSGQPGASTPRVIIRGMATINASTDPLYVVDGVVMQDFNLVNPNDIESMEVLKDASATAIYGARGANGVIMVTTKRGLKGEEGTRISYQGSLTYKTMAKKMEVMNAQEWCDAFMEGLSNENANCGMSWSLNRSDWFNDPDYFDSNGNPLYDTDWQDEATRNTLSHNHQLTFSKQARLHR